MLYVIQIISSLPNTVCYYFTFTTCTYKGKQKSEKKLMPNMDIVHSSAAVVTGYHDYKEFWKPVENEELCCLHEKFNFYDSFAVKTVHKNDETVGYLPR